MEIIIIPVGIFLIRLILIIMRFMFFSSLKKETKRRAWEDTHYESTFDEQYQEVIYNGKSKQEKTEE